MPLLNTDRLVFVYNADSGFFNLLSDMAHKFVSPDTYDCQLCMLTHGNLGMREQWKEYLDSLPAALEFLHRDEFLKNYGKYARNQPLPALFLIRDEQAELFMRETDINACETLDSMIALVEKNIAALV